MRATHAVQVSSRIREMSVANLRTSRSPLAELVRPFLPDIDVDDIRA